MASKPPASKATALKLVPSKTKPREKEDLPLDDPRWRAVIVEHKLLTEREGDPDIAALVLTQALRSGEASCMWRRNEDMVREWLPPGLWEDYQFSYQPFGGLRLARRRGRSEEASLVPVPPGGVAFYLWQPDADRIWPPLAAGARKPEPEAETGVDERRKPGRQVTKRWRLHAAGELHRIVITTGEQPPTAEELAEYCDRKTGYMPDISDVQKFMKFLL